MTSRKSTALVAVNGPAKVPDKQVNSKCKAALPVEALVAEQAVPSPCRPRCKEPPFIEAEPQGTTDYCKHPQSGQLGEHEKLQRRRKPLVSRDRVLIS